MSKHPWPPCVLQVIPALDAGGAERACLDIAGAVRAQGGRALVASTGGRLSAELAEMGGEEVILPMASKNPLIVLANAFRLARLIRAQGVDLVHARSRAPAWSAWIAARMTGTPFVTTFHGFYSAGNPLKRFYNRIMLRGARVIAGSHFMADHIRAVYQPPEDPVAVIHRGIDLRKFDPLAVSPDRIAALRREWRIPAESRIALLPARLTRWKGQILFLEALAKLDPPADLIAVLAGDAQGRNAYAQEISDQACRLGLEDRVRIVGNVADMPAAYAAAEIAVSASLDAEAFGRVPVEAMAMGCTVVAADHGGVSETLRHPDGGLSFGHLFAPGDRGQLSEALQRAAAAPKGGGPERIAAARRHVEKKYSTAQMCAATLTLYRDILQE